MSERRLLEDLLSYVVAENRVCPQPGKWNDLWKVLPKVKGESAPKPLILAAWGEPHLMKAIRLREHIEYAHEHGALGKVDGFLRGLKTEEWFYFSS